MCHMHVSDGLMAQQGFRCRAILVKREAKAVSETELEALDGWFDLEDDFELLSFKAWNAVIYQVRSYFTLLSFLSCQHSPLAS